MGIFLIVKTIIKKMGAGHVLGAFKQTTLKVQ
jgi:hypothetical protein